MAWCFSGDEPLSEPMAASLLMHIYVTQPQWVILFLTWYTEVINHDYMMIFTHQFSAISLFYLQCLRSGEDITIDCAMHYWADTWSTWKVISNSSDIGFIHSKTYYWLYNKYMTVVSEPQLDIVQIFMAILNIICRVISLTELSNQWLWYLYLS